jgi:hypothetical protein
MNNEPKPIMAKPATPKPITVPPVNDTFSAGANWFLQLVLYVRLL